MPSLTNVSDIWAKKFTETLEKDILVSTFISLPKFADLVKEYDSLKRRQWKRKRELEHQMFYVSYWNFKKK